MRASTSREERICSGDMYEGEPMIAVVFVSAKSSAPETFEIPKSSTFTDGEPSGR